MREYFNKIPLRERMDIVNSLKPCTKKSIAKCKTLLDNFYRSKLGKPLSKREMCNLCFRWMWKGSNSTAHTARLSNSKVRKIAGPIGQPLKRTKTINRCSSRKDLKRKQKCMVSGENIDRPPDKKPRKLNGHSEKPFIGPK